MIKYQIRVFICMGRFTFFNCLYLDALGHEVYNEDTLRIVQIKQMCPYVEAFRRQCINSNQRS